MGVTLLLCGVCLVLLVTMLASLALLDAGRRGPQRHT